jgi:hypothetical protein
MAGLLAVLLMAHRLLPAAAVLVEKVGIVQLREMAREVVALVGLWLITALTQVLVLILGITEMPAPFSKCL